MDWNKVQVVRKKKRIPNKETIKALKESRKNLNSYESVEDLYKIMSKHRDEVTGIASYPTENNWKATDTSQAAAESMASKASTLRNQVYAELKREPATADKIAERLEETPFSIRPRLSELKNKGLIIDSGERDFNESNKLAIVWVVV